MVEVSGGRSETPKFPDTDGLQVEPEPYQRANQLSIINGAMSQSQTMVFKAIATKPGKFSIPPVSARIDGKEVTSKPIELTVLEARAPAPVRTPSVPSAPNPSPDPDAGVPGAGEDRAPTPDDAVLITAEVDKHTVYEGEAIQLTLSRWVLRGVQASPYRSADPGYPDTEGFYATELEPRQEDRTRGSWPYHLLQLTQRLYPTRTGTLTIGAWQFNGEGLMRSSNGRLLRQEYALTTDPITITVKPLPERPPNFSGAVGSFTLRPSSAEPTPKTVQQGVPFHLALEVQGDGNPDSIGVPKVPQVTGAMVSKADADSQPKIDTTTGLVTKDFVYTVSPLVVGKLTIPPIEFCYFDPAAERYQTQVVGPFEMDVRPSAEHGAGTLVTNTAPVNSGKVNVIGKDILPNMDAPRSLRPYTHSPVTVGAIGTIPVLAYAGFSLMIARRRRFEQDSAYARSYFAKSKARKRLLNVTSAAEPAEELYRALAEFVADKFDVGGAGLTSSDLRQLLNDRSVDPELTDSIVKIVRSCERARYANVRLSNDEIGALMTATDAAMTKLDQAARETTG